MNCSELDWKAYGLGETGREEHQQHQDHLATCPACRDEVDRLEITRAALLAIPEQEMPRKIAFVSDRVFEPRWWRRIWSSSPAMGLASAALLAGAILTHAFVRPAVAGAPAAQVQTAWLDASAAGEVDRRVHDAVANAVAEIELRDEQRSARMLETAERHFAEQRRSDLRAAEQTIGFYQNQFARVTVAANNRPTEQP